ncbi:peptidylprolyl isomerase [Massilia sp. PAMC28688]|uniref:foldase protein PrsA n=1 Tax=Massilia sp. PAMC28688 TaxID=2861283 RepID=UPI001C62A234|nr:peptidylprolyl isomerase [Massilia sp. PAMC28688]QYF94729.1 peptidylprolyl isomerase [Massilia sp. PAMC28688]
MLMKSRVLMVGAASVLALAACTKKEATTVTTAGTAKTTATATSNEVAATVNGTPIYKDTVDIMVKERMAQGQPDSPELRKAIIDNLAMQTLVANEAVKKGLDKQPETARQMEMLKQSLLAQAYVQDYIKNNAVTDEMVKAEYDKINAKAGGSEYKARHILVATEAEAKDIIAKLQKDLKSFDSLAKSKSMDPGSKTNGGDLGWFNPAGMVPEFGAAVAKLEKGKFTTEPVKSQFGYHVIVLDDSRPITPPPMEQVSDQVKQGLQRQNLKAVFDKMKAEAKIDIKGEPAAAPAPAAPVAPAPAPAQ